MKVKKKCIQCKKNFISENWSHRKYCSRNCFFKTIKTGNTAHSPEGKAYYQAKQRCENAKIRNYNLYGGRGIRVEFKNVKDFLDHIGKKPSKHFSLDRIDNNGNYKKGNIRWANRKTQNRNRRSVILLKINGEKKTLKEWAEIYNIKYRTAHQRYHKGWSTKKILNIK